MEPEATGRLRRAWFDCDRLLDPGSAEKAMESISRSTGARTGHADRLSVRPPDSGPVPGLADPAADQ
ncbi:hypothetical protein [Streptomyces cinerochromogenes]|uniref:hypothetical protein n=1 Tax=Streptomyces cinerochromogenes TaxID=66422 RepID=UPI00167037CE|nr:hypothetical protein [Streptomyces cinerochromogenes]GGS81033.1 hypothetical protein GCM10010206_49550 [Streptomyces cinerochromogenes]